MLVYNQATTGSLSKMPYQVYQSDYSVSPLFLFQDIGEAPRYNHADIETFWTGRVIEKYDSQQSLWGVLNHKLPKMEFFFPVWLLPCLVTGIVFAMLNARFRWPALLAIACTGLSMLASAFHPHYVGGLVPVYLLLCVLGLWKISEYQTSSSFAAGKLISRVILGFHVLGFLVIVLCQILVANHHWSRDRERVINELNAIEGKDLVFVSYSDEHNSDEEWVYNGFDLEEAPVLFVRSMGSDRDQAIAGYYRQRLKWSLNIGDEKKASLKEWGR